MQIKHTHTFFSLAGSSCYSTFTLNYFICNGMSWVTCAALINVNDSVLLSLYCFLHALVSRKNCRLRRLNANKLLLISLGIHLCQASKESTPSPQHHHHQHTHTYDVLMNAGLLISECSFFCSTILHCFSFFEQQTEDGGGGGVKTWARVFVVGRK